jgi:hypothetical protein
MEQQRAPIQFLRTDEPTQDSQGLELWHGVRRSRRGRAIATSPAEQSGPYESSYSIQNGYPDRETLLP